jgi:hypothetical protein
MLTQEEIQKMFEEMGLGSEKERERFNKFTKEGLKSNLDPKHTYKYTSTTSKAEDKEDAELA